MNRPPSVAEINDAEIERQCILMMLRRLFLRQSYMGSAIGLFDTAEYSTATRTLTVGDTMLLLTDGITEAFNIDGRVFTPDRVVQSVTRRVYDSALDLVQSLSDEVARFSQGTEQSDDITCVAVRFTP